MKCCDLTNKVAIITGASRGIGEAIAIQLSKCNANIILTARNAEGLDAVKDSINAHGGRAHAILSDVSSMSSLTKLVSTTISIFFYWILSIFTKIG